MARLRYWGLIHHPKDSYNKQIKGRWLLTKLAGGFLRGEKPIPLEVLVEGNRIQAKGDKIIYIAGFEHKLPQEWPTIGQYIEEYHNQRLKDHSPQLMLNLINNNFI